MSALQSITAAVGGEPDADRGAGAAELLPRKSARLKSGPSTKLNIKKATKRASKKKEVIDYSAKQSPLPSDQDKMLGTPSSASPLALTPSDDPMGKVHNWLMSSQLQAELDLEHKPLCDPPSPLQAPLQVPLVLSPVPKSKSSPAAVGLGLPEAGASGGSVPRRSLVQPTGRLDADKVRLQVMYKTPFKFRLKLKGSGPSGVTTKLSADRVRKHPHAASPTPEEQACSADGARASGGSKRVVGGIAGPRTAMLVRTREPGSSSTNHQRKLRRRESCEAPSPPAPVLPAPSAAAVHECPPTPPRDADIDSNIHTVPSDLEGLLSEVETRATAKKA